MCRTLIIWQADRTTELIKIGIKAILLKVMIGI